MCSDSETNPDSEATVIVLYLPKEVFFILVVENWFPKTHSIIIITGYVSEYTPDPTMRYQHVDFCLRSGIPGM